MRKETKQEIEHKKEVKGKEETPILIGLEIHGYLNTKEKLFCKCKTGFASQNANKSQETQEKPNTKICPICTGQPGSKPMLPNNEALKKLVQISLMLNCKLNTDKKLVWYRKHYNWADLPKGYQNTISGAFVTPCSENGEFGGIRIRETHLEEDPAQWNPDTGKINYNRSGLPLIEIVTEPDFHSSEQVSQWIKDLLLTLSYIKAVKKDAGIKVDVNVSTYGERVEIKNLNSIEKIKQAIAYEVSRQLENHKQGIVQERETLAFDEKMGKTIKMRDKESAQDYRFIPDPDLPCMIIEKKETEKIKGELPESPKEKLSKLITKYKIDKANAEVLTQNLELVDFFEKLAEKVDAKKYISWLTIELLRVLNYNRASLDSPNVDIKPEHMADLIQGVDKKEVTELKAKQIMNSFFPKSFSIKQKSDIGKISSEKEIEGFCKEAIKKNPKAVQDYKAGEKKSMSFLMGEVMKLSNRRADSSITIRVLERLLK